MQDGVEAINELATKAAAEIKEKEQQQQQSQETPEQKAEREAKEADDLKNKQQSQQETPEQKLARETEEKKIADEKAEKEKQQSQPADPIAELLKETKFESKEALIAHLNKKDKKVESPEEKKRSEEVYRANLNRFAVENALLSNDDIIKLETLKQKADRELVFEKFAAEAKEEVEEDMKSINPDATKEEIEVAIKEAFEKEYPLNSNNKNAKSRAENKVAKEAKELRSPLESSFTEAKKQYDEEVSIRNAYPDYEKSMSSLISEKVPSKVSFFTEKDGDEDVPVEVPVSEEAKKEIIDSLTKKLLRPDTYVLYKDGKTEDLKAIVQEEAEYLLWKKIGEEGKKKIAEKFMTRGISKGSTVGAKESFATNQAKAAVSEKMSPADAEQQVLDSTRQKT